MSIVYMCACKYDSYLNVIFIVTISMLKYILNKLIHQIIITYEHRVSIEEYMNAILFLWLKL